MVETGGTAGPRRKLGALAWFSIALVVLILGQVASCSIQMARDSATDSKNQPLSISDADAIKKCEAAVTKNTKNSGSVYFNGTPSITKQETFWLVKGQVSSRQGVDVTEPYDCQVIKFDDGTVGAIETTVGRKSSK
ncbi:hypothetical protein ACTAQI_03860 [Pseudarthrobacter sp. alpha12b]